MNSVYFRIFKEHPVYSLIFLAVLLILVRIVFGGAIKKAGFSEWWSVLMLIPVVNVVLVWIFAYIKWPSETPPDQIDPT